jgi:radical SAM-linked protein
VDDGSGGSPAAARQRWRIVFWRDADTFSDAHPETVEDWATALARAGLPVALSQGKTPRPRVALALPLPAHVAGEAELVDFALTERLTQVNVRTRLDGHLPSGDRLVDLFDVWLGEPTLAARLAAADYRLGLGSATAAELARACTGLLSRASLPRSRPKGDGRVVEYDLRPLLLGLEVAGHTDLAMDPEPSDSITVRMRLLVAQDATSGRPDEVVLALGDELDRALTIDQAVRERLLTVDDLATIAGRG